MPGVYFSFPPRVTLGIQEFGWLREHGVPGESGNPDFRVTLETRSSAWLREEFGLTPGTHISGYSGKRYFQVRLEPGIPGDSGKPGYGWITRSPLDDSVSLKTRRTPFSLIHPGLQESGVLRLTLEAHTSGWPVNPEFRVTSGTRTSVLLRENAVQGVSGKSCLWIREPWVPGDSETGSYKWLRESGVPGE